MRNDYIDFLKGLAALNIILIHTAFWPGGLCVIQEIQTATLIIDVPFFFFLSGWGTALSSKIDLRKKVGSLLATYGKYVQFVVFLYGFMLLSNAALGIGISGKREEKSRPLPVSGCLHRNRAYPVHWRKFFLLGMNTLFYKAADRLLGLLRRKISPAL